MSFVAQCSYCGQKGRVSGHALAESVQCPRCQNWYTAAPADDLPAPPAPLLTVPAAALSPAPAPASSTSEPASQPTAVPVTAPPPRRRRAHRWIHLGGLAACLLGALGLMAASLSGLSLLTIPMSVAGLAVGLGAIVHVQSARPFRRVLPIAGTRKRGSTELEDVALERELLQDQKELAVLPQLTPIAPFGAAKLADQFALTADKVFARDLVLVVHLNEVRVLDKI